MLAHKKQGATNRRCALQECRTHIELATSVPSVSRQLKADRGVRILPHIVAPVENRARGLDAGVCTARRIAVNDRLLSVLRRHMRRRASESRGVRCTHSQSGQHKGAKRESFFDTIEHVIISSFY